MGRVIEWSDDFDVGVSEMNDEHKIIINLIAALFEQNEKGENFERILDTVTELGAYTTKHFSDEEKFMESIGYPNIETHKLIHKKLLSDFTAHAQKIEETKTLPAAFFDFLNMWLTAHIKGIDMKYHPEKGEMKRAG